MSPSLTPSRPILPKPTLLRPEKPRKKSQRGNVRTVLIKEMFPKLSVITAIRKVIMPNIVTSQKTSGSLDDS